MTNTDLNTKFESSGKSSRDFQRWAEGFGVTVHKATISRHRAGTQGITAPWEICYKLFFHQPGDGRKNSKMKMDLLVVERGFPHDDTVIYLPGCQAPAWAIERGFVKTVNLLEEYGELCCEGIAGFEFAIPNPPYLGPGGKEMRHTRIASRAEALKYVKGL